MLKKFTPIQLGHKVRDITTGIEGLAITKSEYLTGNVQYGIQTPAKDGVAPDIISFDQAQLDFVDVGIASRVTPAPADTGIVLGQKYQDIVSKIEGIATRKTTFMNGCVYYSIACEKDSENSAKEDFVEHKRLKHVGAGVAAVIAKKITPFSTITPAPGGPNTRLMARR
jgi:hypothetical protein